MTMTAGYPRWPVASVFSSSSAVVSSSRLASGSAAAAAVGGRLRLLRWFSMLSTKKTTGIYGRDVIPNSREVLIDCYKKIIAKATELGPNPLNQYVIKTATYFLSICEKHTDVNQIEASLEMGQMEDMIEVAENQMDMLVYLNSDHGKRKFWEHSEERDKEYREHFHPVFGDAEYEGWMGTDTPTKVKPAAPSASATAATAAGGPGTTAAAAGPPPTPPPPVPPATKK